MSRATVCAATGNNVLKLRTTQFEGTASDPRLHVWTSNEKDTPAGSGIDPEPTPSPDSCRVHEPWDTPHLKRINCLYRYR
ncbi:MAG: hypothetical protein JSW03_02865 [Candidatus Eiseniibacteriota bacterium]|nr:MAG: hypothetical protein JSW03_02865 [Candidatus Eisenbacteria bacterium]